MPRSLLGREPFLGSVGVGLALLLLSMTVLGLVAPFFTVGRLNLEIEGVDMRALPFNILDEHEWSVASALGALIDTDGVVGGFVCCLNIVLLNLLSALALAATLLWLFLAPSPGVPHERQRLARILSLFSCTEVFWLGALFYLIESHETIGVHPGAGFVGVTLATVAMPCALLVGHVACTRAQAALDAPG